MILCSCNCLSHRDVDSAIDEGATRPAEVYSRCGKRPECGCCIRSILSYLRSRNEALPEGVPA